MQFLESSVLGLRSAFYEFSCPDKQLKIVVLPMVHIGLESYYKEVSQELKDCDNVIFEGVKSKKAWLITQAYKIVAKRKSLGLVTQKSRLKLKELKLNLIHGDISSQAFTHFWQEIPFLFRFLLMTAAPLYGCWQYLVATPTSLAKDHSVESLPMPNEIDEDGSDCAYTKVMMDEREKVLVEVIQKHIETYGDKSESTAIVWGASHMPTVVSVLRQYGFQVSSSRWVQVI